MSNDLVSILQEKCREADSYVNIRTEKYFKTSGKIFNQDRIFLTFREEYSGPVSFHSLQMSKHNHYNHHHQHLSFLASGDHSQDQHSTVLKILHIDEESCSLL